MALRALIAATFFTLFGPSAAAAQHFIGFEEPEWDGGCVGVGACPGVGFVIGTPPVPNVVEAGCIYGRCLQATFGGLDTESRSLVPMNAGWVPHDTRFYIETSVKLDPSMEGGEINVDLAVLRNPTRDAYARVLLWGDSSSDAMNVEVQTFERDSRRGVSCRSSSTIPLGTWFTVTASFDLESGRCTSGVGGTSIEGSVARPSLLSSFGSVAVLSTVWGAPSTIFPVYIGVDEVCIGEAEGDTTFCETRRDSPLPWPPPGPDAGIDAAAPDAAAPDTSVPDVGVTPDASDGSTTVPPSDQTTFRGAGGCDCGASNGTAPLGPAAGALLFVAWMRRRRRR